LSLKCTKIDFSTYSAPSDPLAGIKRPTSKRRGGFREGKGRRTRGRQGRGEEKGGKKRE